MQFFSCRPSARSLRATSTTLSTSLRFQSPDQYLLHYYVNTFKYLWDGSDTATLLLQLIYTSMHFVTATHPDNHPFPFSCFFVYFVVTSYLVYFSLPVPIVSVSG